MELRQLEQFVAVAEERHFTRAAARVHVVQSSLSAAVAALERELGDTLFVRNSRQVTLTPAGRALLPAARRALAAADDGRDAVAKVRGVLHGHLRIGAIQTLGVIDLPAILAEFRRRHPAVTLQITHTTAPALARAVADAEIDIAFIDGPVGARLARVEIGRDRLVLAVSRDDPLARHTVVALGDPILAEREFISYRTDSSLEAQISTACAAAGLARHIVCAAANIGYLVELVRHGAGVAVLPPQAIPRGIEDILTITLEPPLHRDICAVIPADRTATGPAQGLLELINPLPGPSRRSP